MLDLVDPVLDLTLASLTFGLVVIVALYVMFRRIGE